jgi:phosphotransferase system enzyme I (PtsI)
MIGVQDAMLEDPAWLAAAVGQMRQGGDAAAAWRHVLDREAASYAASPDPLFAARAADIRDVRDRVMRVLLGAPPPDPIPHGVIYLSGDIALSRFLGHDWTGGGVALQGGSEMGHVAVLARQRAIPMLVGLGDGAQSLPNGTPVMLDATAGCLASAPSRWVSPAPTRARAPFSPVSVAVTRDGTRIALSAAMSRMEDLAALDPASAAGIGLMRTEFAFGGGLAGEEEHAALYEAALGWADGRPVSVRLMDWGGDKPLPGGTQRVEANPLLGTRGVRLMAAEPDLFRPQIRALLRAATRPGLQVLLPMVSAPDEIDQAHALFEAEAGSLARAGVPHAVPPIGIMVEVPAVALALQRFRRAAFAAVGTNDLAQFTLASARDNAALARRLRGLDPAVLALVTIAVEKSAALGMPVSLCGDAASEPDLVPALLQTGLRSLTVAPPMMGEVAAAIACAGLGEIEGELLP